VTGERPARGPVAPAPDAAPTFTFPSCCSCFFALAGCVRAPAVGCFRTSKTVLIVRAITTIGGGLDGEASCSSWSSSSDSDSRPYSASAPTGFPRIGAVTPDCGDDSSIHVSRVRLPDFGRWRPPRPGSNMSELTACGMEFRYLTRAHTHTHAGRLRWHGAVGAAPAERQLGYSGRRRGAVRTCS
jgi:hypothetical protein